jgi:hypothetical protein
MTTDAARVGRIRQQLREQSPRQGICGRACGVLSSVGLLLAAALCIRLNESISPVGYLIVPITLLYANLVDGVHHMPSTRCRGSIEQAGDKR